VVELSRPYSSEEDLVQGVMQRHPAAIAELFDRFASHVRRTLIRTLGTDHDVDDLTQETFIAVIRRCSTLRDPSALRSFVVSVAIRLARNELRKRSIRRFVGLADDVQVPCAGPHDAELAEGLRHLYDAIDRLGTEARLAFVLRHVEGYDLADTARLCGCSLATIKRRLAKAQAKFETIAGGDPVLRELLQCTGGDA
jgi:RNA polymerase sigma-70 factor (ECF subfamily)